MTTLFVDRVQESSTSTGTGDIALGGISQPGLATFSSAFSDGALVSYVITNQAVNTEFERGIGTFHSGPDSISRTYVLAGTAYPSPTNFSAGTKNVVNPAPANTAGNAYASSYVYVPGDTAVLSGTTWYSLNVNSNSVPSTGNPNWASLGGGGAGAVTSVFSRTGAITAQASDYSTYYGGLATANTWTQTNTFDLSLSIANGYGLTAPGGAALVTGPGGGTFGITAGSGGASTLHLGPTPGGNGAYWIIDTNLNATISSIQSGASTGSSPSLTLQGWNGSASVGMQFAQGYANFFIQPTGAGASGAIIISPSSNLNLITTQSGAASNSPLLMFYGWSGSAAETNYIYGSSTGALNTKNNILDNGSGGATFTGTIAASNFSGSSSGTNTGDQNLTPYALLSGATFTGLVTNTGSYIREYYGASGNYATVGSDAWGGPIWGIDTSWTGGVGAANWAPTSVYGIAWQRASSSNANSNVGEGLYVYQNGTLQGGIGSAGIYTPGVVMGGSFQVASSISLKQDITPLEDTSILDKMNFYSYRLKANPDKLHFGLIAEELAEISSDLVGYDKDGKPFSINMLELIPLLAKRIETLTKEVAVLRAAK